MINLENCNPGIARYGRLEKQVWFNTGRIYITNVANLHPLVCA